MCLTCNTYHDGRCPQEAAGVTSLEDLVDVRRMIDELRIEVASLKAGHTALVRLVRGDQHLDRRAYNKVMQRESRGRRKREAAERKRQAGGTGRGAANGAGPIQV